MSRPLCDLHLAVVMLVAIEASGQYSAEAITTGGSGMVWRATA